MPQITASKEKGPPPEKFRAHGVLDDWLNQAMRKPIQVRLVDGQTLTGRLAGHDLYCLALEEAGQADSTLIYKHSIACLNFRREQ